MSIETSPPPSPAKMGTEKHSKKHKSSHGEKKRKRDKEDGGHSKLKKHRSTKSQEVSSSTTENKSPFHIQSASLYLPLAPISQSHPLEGLCAEHLSPLLLTFYPPLGGVVLAYNNVQLSESPQPDSPSNAETPILLQSIDEYGASFCWVTATFVLFKPEKGVELEGYVNLQNQGHVGVVCWNLFNASIEAKRLPSGWRWKDVSEMDALAGAEANANGGYAEDGVGCWVDENGDKIEGQIKFRVREVESSHDRERGFVSIEGTLLGEEEEAELDEKEAEERLANGEGGKARRDVSAGRKLGATDLGVPVEKDVLGEGIAPRKKSRGTKSRY